MNLKNSDLIVVGHFSIDSISLPAKKVPLITLGGAVTFISLVSKRLGVDAAIISKIGKDFPEEYLKQLEGEGVDLTGIKRVPSETSTRFSLEYDKTLQNRKLRLISKASPIIVRDLPISLGAKTIHVAPIANEIEYEVVNQLRKATGILSLDPQGLLRNFDEKGYVHRGLPLDKRLLRMINVYKSSQEEISMATDQRDLKTSIKSIHDLGVNVVIVTQGVSGLIISFEGKTHKIPAYPSRKTVDPTGAGDVFVGAFLSEYIREKDPLWCACVGSAAASLIVEHIGPVFPGNKQEIFERAQVIYEKEIKQ